MDSGHGASVNATLLSALEELLGACLTTRLSTVVEAIECLCCSMRTTEDEFPLELHDESMPCGRAAAAIRAAKGDE